MFKKHKNLLVLLFITLLTITVLSLLNHKIYQPPILGKLKLKYISSENYQLTYKGEKIAGKVTAVDSWYVQNPYVYGSTTNFKTSIGDGIIYFFINVCDGNIFETESSIEFENYLNGKKILKNKRNWMSGDNAIDIKRAEYSSNIDCNNYQ
ncbi:MULTISPECIES: hypothetical protein [Psychrobacter]|uniref:Uncharacterized protein n=1 Tax=Psychrobacter halodurans TaxID=2818439 RepID=A0AAW4IPA3_9GAMM|nr:MULTISPECIES: hypothetical protein [Psychrobacter]MBO1517134.1 hypothetical protein [Psychrobacter halodurans]OLF40243.1 hypothetical protein BTV99_10075 [Psychrobacter sp. Rd 27.2]PJX27192.1 hypothetical protein CAP50_01365 [Psychrobacter sp. L7]